MHTTDRNTFHFISSNRNDSYKRLLSRILKMKQKIFFLVPNNRNNKYKYLSHHIFKEKMLNMHWLVTVSTLIKQE